MMALTWVPTSVGMTVDMRHELMPFVERGKMRGSTREVSEAGIIFASPFRVCKKRNLSSFSLRNIDWREGTKFVICILGVGRREGRNRHDANKISARTTRS
jgi:hypothetical protein